MRLQLICINVFILFFLLGALLLTIRIIDDTFYNNTIIMNERMIRQTEENIKGFHDTMNSLATATVYSPTTYDFISQTLLDRILSLSDLHSVFSNAMSIEENIAGIYLYDNQPRQIAGMGKEIISSPFEMRLKKEIEYSGAFNEQQTGAVHYTICFPVFDIKSQLFGQQIGQCVFMMNTDNLNKILSTSLTTEHSEVCLVDAEGIVIASASDNTQTPPTSRMIEAENDYIITVYELPMKGWQLIGRLPKEDLTNDTLGTKGFIMISYLIAAILIVSAVSFSYWRVILPLHRIELFIRRIVKAPESRLAEVRTDEIGAVINSLNHMLDDREVINRKLQESQKKIYEAEATKNRLQLLALRNQINPHFLYNTFECIRAMALYYNVDSIAEITMALAKLLRYVVKAENIVSVGEELDYINEYAKIINQRFMGKIAVNVVVEESIRDIRIIKLMLQPLIENAVFHGLEPKCEMGEVHIDIRRHDDNKITFIIEDDGVGMDEQQILGIKASFDTQGKTSNIGIANIYQRLRFFYQNDFSFDIKSNLSEGTAITIIIPDVVNEEYE